MTTNTFQASNRLRAVGLAVLVAVAAVLQGCTDAGDGVADAKAMPEALSSGHPAETRSAMRSAMRANAASKTASAEFAAAIGFYDVTRDGATRAIRNDMTGTLPGMVQFAQSHTVDPAGNAAKNMPRLVASRNALLLFTPQLAGIGNLRLEVRVNGELRHTAAMNGPENLPGSDFVDPYGRTPVLYSKRAWSAPLPWTVVQPGMSLQVISDAGLQGQLAAQNIEIAAPAKLVLWGVRLGMLTDPPVYPERQPMLAEPAIAAADYFQTLPVSQLIIASYEDQRLTEVMLGNGTILTTASSVNGGVYDGDLREDVGKSQYSIGINLANYGISSSINGNQDHDKTTPQLVYHHSAGNYANGRQEHGLSGGGSIATLYESEGNEWSHELGHHYGMGHYPGSVNKNYFWSAHHADSGWGFIDHRGRFRSSLAFHSGVRTGLQVNSDQVGPSEAFAGLYSYNADAMSGGEVITPAEMSRYTHHTGYTAMRTQNFVDKAWFDPASATGYSRWDAATAKVVEARPAGKARPSRFGVAVFTLLGGYDPLNGRAVMYPPAKGNYGMVYDALPAADANAAQACWVQVDTPGGSRTIALHGSRIVSSASNKFHINIAQADDPQTAAVFCRSNGATQKLDEVAFPPRLPAMAPAVVVGESAGYEALAAEEMKRMGDLLRAMSTDAQPVPQYTLRVWLETWQSRVVQLDATARATSFAIEHIAQKAGLVDRWMTDNGAALDARTPVSVRDLRRRLTDFGLIPGSGYASSFAQILNNSGCMAVAATGQDAATAMVVVAPAASCRKLPEQLWLQDKRGALHNGAFPGHCVTLQGTRLALLPCHSESVAQFWTWTSGSTLTSVARPDLSMDMVSSTREVIAYGTHGGSNQRWREVRQDRSALVSYLSSANVRRLYAIEPLNRPPPRMVQGGPEQAPAPVARVPRACDALRTCMGDSRHSIRPR